MISATQQNTQTAIFARLIEPARANLTADAAHCILNLAFATGDVERMNQLAARAGEGALTPEEGAELEEYRRAGDILALMKSKARLTLKSLDSRS